MRRRKNSRVNGLYGGQRVVRERMGVLGKIEVFAAIAAHVVTALAGAGAFCLYLWTVHMDYTQARDVRFSQEWVNYVEGCIDCSEDENEEVVTLKLQAYDGKLFGELFIDDLSEDGIVEGDEQDSVNSIVRSIARLYTHRFFVEGNLWFDNGNILLYNYLEGKKLFFGEAGLRLRNGKLYLDMRMRPHDGIPSKAVLFYLAGSGN